jgi:hypothetical protein
MNRTRTRPPRRTVNGVHVNGVNHRGAGLPPAPSETEVNGKPPEPAPVPKPADGRTAGGKFGYGNTYGKGNPFSRKLGAMRSAFLNAVSEADVAAVARSLLKKAQAGDVEAARLYLSYALGKPAAVVEPDTLDLDEMGLLLRYPADECEQQAMMEGARAPASVAALKEETYHRVLAGKEQHGRR